MAVADRRAEQQAAELLVADDPRTVISAAVARVYALSRVHDESAKMTAHELAERLTEADRLSATLRRCTLEWRALGRRILTDRRSGPQRPDDRRRARG